jgi:phage terminase large subunit GpA-like protein
MVTETPPRQNIQDGNVIFTAFRPMPSIRMLPWCVDSIVTDQGRPYDDAAYPHLGAPGGPCDEFDNPACRTIALQFATRLGKTFFGQCGILKTAATDPGPMMIASSTERLAKEVTGRTYKMIHGRPPLNKLLVKSKRNQRQDCIEFTEAQVFIGWSRSPTTLSDKNVKVGLAGELGKWEHQSTSKEPHPQKMYADRFKDYQSTRKVIYESTPTITGRCPIERLLYAGTNCHLYVACPLCGRYQRLRMRDADGTTRLRWDKGPGGKSDKDIARRTAHYACEACNGRIEDHHRAAMMRGGVWCPEGCTVNSKAAAEEIDRRPQCGTKVQDVWTGWGDAAWIEGTPVRDTVDASYQLSSLYALSVGWGDIAAEFVQCKSRPAELRNFVMQWLGETWAVAKSLVTWEQLAERSITAVPQYVVPRDYSLLTCGIDKQEDHYVFVVEAWKPDGSSHTVDYGTVDDVGELRTEILTRTYQHEDGGKGVKIACTLMDSGYRPQGVYEFARDCRRDGIIVIPCKGSNTTLGAAYKRATLSKDSSMPGGPLIHVDTLTSQDWIEKQIGTLRRDDAGGWGLFAGSVADHQDHLEQLLNDAPVDKIDPTNNVRIVWERLDDVLPNDYRDCKRYAYVARLVKQRGAAIRPRIAPEDAKPDPKPKKKRQKSHLDPLRRPGGWLQR